MGDENTNLQKYGGWDDEDIERGEKLLRQQGTLIFKLEEGEHRFRFLPPPAGQPLVAVVREHGFRAPSQDGKGRYMTLACPQATTGAPCPFCAKARKLRQSPNRLDQKRADDYDAKPACYANVVDMDATADGVRVLKFGKSIYDKLKKIKQNPRKGGNFWDAQAGRDIYITRSGTGRYDTEYDVEASHEPSPIAEPAWLEAQWPLSAYSTPPTVEQIKRMVRGGDDDDGDPAAVRRGAPSVPADGVVEGEILSEDDLAF